MLTENSTKSTQARVFGYFAFVGNLGITMGPAMGMKLESISKSWANHFLLQAVHSNDQQRSFRHLLVTSNFSTIIPMPCLDSPLLS